MNSQQEQDQYILVPRSRVLAPNSESKTLSQSSASIGSAASGPLLANAPAKSQVAESKDLAPVMLSRSSPRRLNLVTGDAPLQARLGLVSTGNWINTAATPTTYSGLMTPNGCNEFASFAKLYEQYKVNKIHAVLYTGQVNASRAVSGTSVSTGTPIAYVWANSPLPSAPSFSDIVDMTDMKIVSSGMEYTHSATIHPKGCYAVVDAGYAHAPGWQSTSDVSKHIWGTFTFASLDQAVTASGIPYTVVYLFDTEFRRRRYTP